VARILIVDDDEGMRDVIRARLEDSYEIIDTGDPDRALAMALEHKPDAILLDLLMPKFSGFEICQTLASLSLTQQIPILIVSVEAAARYKAFCENLSAVGYFDKPIDFEQLRARLTAVLRNKRPERRTEVRVRLSAALKLRGKDKYGTPFELATTTENVSANGFLCACTAALEKDATVEVFLCSAGEPCVGTARAVRADCSSTPYPRYGFRFVAKVGPWILQ
jgi:DNA-binding response OmpR family regulator